MPSPFPGMDPFLEQPQVFPDLHDSLVTYLREALQACLPAPYYAATGQRVWVEVSERWIGPDVRLARREATAAPRAHGGAVAAAGRAVIVHVPHDERREPFLEIFASRGGERRLVTTIEVLSPTNKTPGEQGRGLYLRKQQEVLGSRTHLVEIDLLRGGEHTTAVPRERAVAAAGPFDYHVCVRRWDAFEDFVVYPVRLEEALPEVAIPLLPGDPPVVVDLQAVFTRCYDTGPYRREIEYENAEPVPPLRPEHVTWVRQRLAGAEAPGAE